MDRVQTPEFDLVTGDRVDSAEYGVVEGEIHAFKICALISQPNQGVGKVYDWLPISALTKATRQ